MRTDVSQMIGKMDAVRERTDEIAESLERILDRGNRPSINFVNEWGENQAQVLQLLPEIQEIAARLSEDIENVSEEDTQGLLKSQSLFRDSQTRIGQTILRTKKALGLIP